MLTTTADGLPDDDGWVFRPHERGWMAIPLGDVALDMPDQSADGVERATANRLAREDAEPGLDHVEPGGALGGEVKLDLRLLVETEHHGVRGRIQIQADHVVDLVFGRGISRELERRHSVRLEGMRPPDAMHRAVRDARLPRKVAGRPMGETGRWWLQGPGHDLRALASRDGRRPAGPRPILQPSQAVFREAPPHAADLHHGVAGAVRDLHSGHALSHQQHGPGSSAEPGRRRWRALQPLELTPLRLADDNGANAIGHGFPPGSMPWRILT